MTKSRTTTQPKARQLGRPAGTGKLAKLESMLRRPEGTTIPKLVKALGWQAHSVRGAMSGSLKKKGCKIESAKEEGKERVYRIAE